MNIAIPNELSTEERRVAITPAGVHALARDGHTVLLECGAGETSGFQDGEYEDVGASVIFSAEEAFRRANLVVKVMPPTEAECGWLNSEQTIFSFLDLGIARKAAIQLLRENMVTAVGYENIAREDGSRPVLTAMSEIAGNMTPQIASRFLECRHGGRGITLGGVAGIPPASVVIVGAGVLGFNATRAFLATGAQVMVMDRDLPRLRHIDQFFNKRPATSLVTPFNIEKAARFSDVLVGAVMVLGETTPHVIPKDVVSKMKEGSVILDASIDQGGCVETSRPTTHSDPVFIVDGVIHYCVPNIPAAVARTSSHALNNALLPLISQLANTGVESALAEKPSLRKGLYTYRGEFTSRGVARLMDAPCTDVNDLLKG